MNKKSSNVFILQNHGLIIGAETPRDAEVLQNKILNLTKLNKREFQFKQNDKLRYLSTKLSFKLLFDPDSKLEDKFINEQFAY